MTGRIGKRRAPTNADFISIAPTDSLQTSVDLSECFEFQADHEYSVNIDMELRVKQNVDGNHEARQMSGLLPHRLHSAPHTFAAIETSPRPQASIRPGARALKTVGFIGCDSSQTQEIESAIVNAEVALANAYDEVTHQSDLP